MIEFSVFSLWVIIAIFAALAGCIAVAGVRLSWVADKLADRTGVTGVLLLAMLHREKAGIGNIGFESALVLLLYAGSVVLLFL